VFPGWVCVPRVSIYAPGAVGASMTPMRIGLTLPLLFFVASCGGEPAAPAGADMPSASVAPEPYDPDAAANEEAALAPCGVVTAQGYCGVAFGMSAADAAANFPVKLESYDGADGDVKADASHCYEMFAEAPVQGVSFMVENQKVGRIDFLSEVAKTADGFGVGTSSEAVHARFGAAAMDAPNKYEPEVIDLTVTDGATKYVFEIQDGKVRGWRAGVAPTIDYTEHCS